MERTLEIDDDVLAAAEELAGRQHKSVDRVISELSRHALKSNSSAPDRSGSFPGLPLRGVGPITLEFVNELRDGSVE